MDNYNKENEQFQNNYGGDSSYPVDPQDNSYRYTGTESDAGHTAENIYGSYTNGQAEQPRDRYYSPYERRTMAESGTGDKREKGKKKHGFGVTVAKCACLAAVFGLVGGGVFGGVNYLIPQKEQVIVNETQQPSALTTTPTNETEQQALPYLNGATVVSDVSAIVEKAMPSIVAITNMTEREYRTFFGQTFSKQQDYAGSGFIVSEDDNYLYIATNNHVVDGATTLTVQFCDGSTAAVEVKGTSPGNDLAVVKVAKSDIEEETRAAIQVATINDKGSEKVGEPVIAIGNALGYGQSVTSGIISALEREVTAQDSTTGESYTNTLTQTDASINPGNSGGALLNVNGEVIGINSSKIGGEYVDGVGFAIPMTIAAPIINELITREKVTEEKAAYLGVNGFGVDQSVSESYNVPSGIYVAKVYEGSAAAKAGMQQGDIITEFDGHSVATMEDLNDLMQYRAAGTEVKITICRTDNGQYVEHELDVTLGSKD